MTYSLLLSNHSGFKGDGWVLVKFSKKKKQRIYWYDKIAGLTLLYLNVKHFLILVFRKSKKIKLIFWSLWCKYRQRIAQQKSFFFGKYISKGDSYINQLLPVLH